MLFSGSFSGGLIDVGQYAHIQCKHAHTKSLTFVVLLQIHIVTWCYCVFQVYSYSEYLYKFVLCAYIYARRMILRLTHTQRQTHLPNWVISLKRSENSFVCVYCMRWTVLCVFLWGRALGAQKTFFCSLWNLIWYDFILNCKRVGGGALGLAPDHRANQSLMLFLLEAG